MLKCSDCRYWIEAEGYERKDNIGGCTYTTDTPRYYPMFLDEECQLVEPHRTKVMNENRKLKKERTCHEENRYFKN